MLLPVAVEMTASRMIGTIKEGIESYEGKYHSSQIKHLHTFDYHVSHGLSSPSLKNNNIQFQKDTEMSWGKKTIGVKRKRLFGVRRDQLRVFYTVQ